MMSLAEFDEIIEPEDQNQELDEGVLLALPKPHARHNRVAGRLFFRLNSYLNQNPCGEVFQSAQMYILGSRTKRAPDVSVVLKPRVVSDDFDLDGAPDIAVEVMSPLDSPPAVHRKLKQYFAAGCRTAIVIYPESREVELWEAPGVPDQLLTANDVLTLAMLPGFMTPVASLFSE